MNINTKDDNNQELKNQIMEIATDVGEPIFDSIFDEGLLRDIPALGVIINIAKTGKNIRDILYIKNIVHFVEGINKANEEDLNKWFKKASKDIKKNNKIGETILYALQFTDEKEKARLIGILFMMLIEKEIEKEEFYTLVHIINYSIFQDILNVQNFITNETLTQYNPILEDYHLDRMYIVGILKICGISGGDVTGDNSGNIYCLNKYGEILLKTIKVYSKTFVNE